MTKIMMTNNKHDDGNDFGPSLGSLRKRWLESDLQKYVREEKSSSDLFA